MIKSLSLTAIFFLPFLIKAQIPLGYYNTTQNLQGIALKEALNNIIDNHIEYPYTSTSTDVWDILKQTDQDSLNLNNVILVYSGLSVNAEQEYNSGKGWTREHVWAKSRGDFGTTKGAGTDLHHLKPCHNTINTARNNRWFGECNEEYILGDTLVTGCFTSSQSWLWKPREEVKGDIARMIFYMATRYEGENGELDLEVVDYIPSDKFTNEPIHATLADLIVWHLEDPVDNFEKKRNDIIFTYQQNRNPYIDNPDFVLNVFSPLTSINEQIDDSLLVYRVYDINGRLIDQGREIIGLSNYENEAYIILLIYNNGTLKRIK